MDLWTAGSLGYAVVEITNRCNLRCPHCASVSGLPREGELTAAEWEGVLGDLRALGCEEVTLLGGEVFLSPDWARVARCVTGLGMELCIVTNGLPLDARRIEELEVLGVDRLGVSLDGASPEVFRAVRGVDGFDKVWGAITRVRDRGVVSVTAISTFSRRNLADFDRLAALVGAAGITWQVQFAAAVGSRFAREEMLSPAEHAALCRRLGDLIAASADAPWIATMDDFGYFPLDERHAALHCGWDGCKAGRSVIGIRANGDVLGCLSLGDAFVEANVRSRSVMDLWRDPGAFAALRDKERHLTGACRACPMAETCRAGCSGMAWAATGGLGDNPYCLRRVECGEILEAMGLDGG